MTQHLRSGQTLTGMVKSYNRKGFGFIMCQAIETDIYFSRDSLHPLLQTSDLAGENVTFEVHRFSDGKLTARNLRPTGDVSDFMGNTQQSYAQNYGAKGGKLFQYSPRTGSQEEEDRSRDWYCKSCGERNFVKRFECYKCKSMRPRDDGTETYVAPAAPVGVKRTLSPHAGSRAMREVYKQNLGARQRSRSRKREPSSSSASSSSSRKRRKKSSKKKGKKKSKKKRSRSKSSASAISSGSDEKKGGVEEIAAKEGEPANPEVEAAKTEALEKLQQLRELQPRDARLREWRVLLRQWHPDKNPDRVEVATAVFQFLQKGKALIDFE